MIPSTSRIVSAVAATAAVLALSTAPAASAAGKSAAQSCNCPGQYEKIVENSKASAMMLGLINEDYVWILDKVENNRDKVPGSNKPAWGSILNLNDNSVNVIDVNTNTFCASGSTLGNGSWVVAGGNQPITYGGQALAENESPATQPYGDYDGRKALRIMEPVASGANNASISWSDNPGGNVMQSQRWYPGMETMADGSIILIGGATGGGYINRNYPNLDPATSGGGSNPTYEYFPSKGTQKTAQFMIKTSGLNMYPHMYLLPSGNMFMQANYSTTIWKPDDDSYTDLPDMPGQIVRVYPASGATAMLPLTPANKYTPTILFCGGFATTDALWGDFTAPRFNALTTAASDDCSSITPSNSDGSDNAKAQYVTEEKLPEPRTMGQFIHLPNGQMVIVNGAQKGTAGYGNVSTGATTKDGFVWDWTNVFNTSDGQTVYTESMSQDPTYQPVLYDPEQPMGSRLTRDGFGSSTIARLYHSTALLLPDGSVLVGGSNPHMDVALTMPQTIAGIRAFNTTYELEKWYPMYYFKTRPEPTGLPDHILYGGKTFTFNMDSNFMGDSANYKANNTKIMVIRPGYSTHAMNMNQRSLQLEHSFTVNGDGSVSYTVMPMPTNVNLFPPGPALLFVTIDGVPSKGKYVMIGQSQAGGTVPFNYAAAAGTQPSLPASVTNAKYNATPDESGAESFGIGKIVGIAVGAAALILLILLGLLCWRRQSNKKSKAAGGYGGAGGAAAAGGAVYGQSSYRDGGAGGEYKRVNTPASSVGAFPGAGTRGSLATYDSYRMQDVSGPNTPYYDSPRNTATRSPLGQDAATLGGAGDYASQGWGEHRGGDAGDYYRDNMDRSDGGAAQYYNQGSHHASQYSYGSQGRR